MKKYKLIKTLLITTPIVVTPLIANSCNANTKAATNSQIKNAIFTFARNHGINKNNIATKSIKYQASSVKDEKELITFSFNENKNISSSYLTNQYNGSMTYDTNKQKFSLNKWNDRKIPGKLDFNSEYPSTIFSNKKNVADYHNNFTLAINGSDVKTIDVAFEFNYTVKELFNALGLDLNKVQNYQLNDFKDIYNHNYGFSSSDVSIVFHIVNQKVVWTNINNSAEDALPTPDGNINSMALLNQTNDKYNLLLNASILKQLDEIYQLNNNFNTNQYLQQAYLKDHWAVKKNSLDEVTQWGIEIASAPDAFKSGNASIDDVVVCLLNLLKNDYSKLTEMLSKNYQAYNLIFNKTNDVWTFDSYSQFTN